MVLSVINEAFTNNSHNLFSDDKRGRCSSIVVSVRGVMDHRIDPSWWTHCAIIYGVYIMSDAI